MQRPQNSLQIPTFFLYFLYFFTLCTNFPFLLDLGVLLAPIDVLLVLHQVSPLAGNSLLPPVAVCLVSHHYKSYLLS